MSLDIEYQKKNEEMLTVDELAKSLKVPKSWVYGQTRLKGTMTIPKIRIGKYIRFRLNDVLAWLNSQQPE